MSSPREAIYDVLIAQRQRTRDQASRDRLADEWAEYERQAAVANAAYRSASRRQRDAS
jgi:hypothetical protein